MELEREVTAPRLAYLVRCWLVETEQGPVWRAAVEDPYTAEHRGFANLNALFEFLTQETTTHTPPRVEDRSNGRF